MPSVDENVRVPSICDSMIRYPLGKSMAANLIDRNAIKKQSRQCNIVCKSNDSKTIIFPLSAPPLVSSYPPIASGRGASAAPEALIGAHG